MQPHGGFLIAAVVVLAIATGCKREDHGGSASHEGPHRRAVVPAPPADVTAVDAPAPRRAPRPAPASRPGLGQARNELDELAQDARQLRRALLHADFRDPPDKTKEAENDPR